MQEGSNSTAKGSINFRSFEFGFWTPHQAEQSTRHLDTIAWLNAFSAAVYHRELSETQQLEL